VEGTEVGLEEETLQPVKGTVPQVEEPRGEVFFSIEEPVAHRRNDIGALSMVRGGMQQASGKGPDYLTESRKVPQWPKNRGG
jgi:hypothetical protein